MLYALYRPFIALLFFVVAQAGLAAPTTQPQSAPAQSTPTELALRNAALTTIYQFDLSSEQLRSLRNLAAPSITERKPGKAGPKLMQAMQDLHAALIKGSDDDRIDALQDDVDDQRDDSDVELDDTVRVSDSARSRATQTLKLLKSSQLAAYIAIHVDDIADPTEELIDTVGTIRQVNANDWEEQREDTAGDVAILVGGLDAAKASELQQKVGQFLSAIRAMNDDTFRQKRSELERQAEQIVGEIAPMTALEHWITHQLATLLSNPQLAAAIDEKLK